MVEPPRAVFDCMIFVQAAIRPEPVHATIRLVQGGKITLCVSAAIIDEVREVLLRPRMRARFPALEPEVVARFLTSIFSVAQVVENVLPAFSLPRDKKDEPYINLAIAVEPSYLVTWNNRHLTYLMRKDTPEGVAFCDAHPRVNIVDPPAFIRQVYQLFSE